MKPDTALILETNNLKGGGARVDRIEASLARLLRQLAQQTRPPDELIVTHEGLDADRQARLESAAGRAIRFTRVPEGTGYYDAKNAGFDASTAPLVAFGDADCWPEPEWLERLFAPLEAGASAVAGRTCYRQDLLGTAATTLDFLYYPSPSAPGATRNFYANNVAFRREVFAENRYRPGPFYRGHCQVLGLRLQAAGIPIHFEPGARTTHRFPDTRRELLRLRFLRGADATAFAPFLAEAYAPPQLEWLGRLGPVSGLASLGARIGFSLRAINHQDMPEVHGLKRAACVGLVAALTAADGVGALLPRRRRERETVLSYHAAA